MAALGSPLRFLLVLVPLALSESIACPSVTKSCGLAAPLDFVVDRRPVVMYNTWIGQPNPDKLGRIDWWRDSNDTAAVDRLLQYLNKDYEGGWRRGCLRLPAGSLAKMYMASAQFYTLTVSRVQALLTQLNPWLAARPDYRLGIYTGWDLAVTPSSSDTSVLLEACTLDMTEHRRPDTNSQRDRCALEANVQGWLALGIKELWYDASTKDLGFDDWVQRPTVGWAGDGDPLKIASESVPVYRNPSNQSQMLLNASRITKHAFVVAYNVLTFVTYDSWEPLDESSTEIVVMLTGHTPKEGYPVLSQDVVYDLHVRGFALMPVSEQTKEWVKRVLGSGAVRCSADFDFDGRVDGEDVRAFRRQWQKYLGKSQKENGARLAFHNGDVNGDGRVTQSDWMLFASLHDEASLSGSCSSPNLLV